MKRSSRIQRGLAAVCVSLIMLLSSVFTPHARADERVVDSARELIGTPYRWGGADRSGSDCSGLVVLSYRQVGIELPHSSQALAHVGVQVAREDMEPGDIVVYYPAASHVAIYVGDGDVVHASSYGRPVAEVTIDAAGPFNTARRP